MANNMISNHIVDDKLDDVFQNVEGIVKSAGDKVLRLAYLYTLYFCSLIVTYLFSKGKVPVLKKD